MSCRLKCKIDLALANMTLALTLVFPSSTSAAAGTHSAGSPPLETSMAHRTTMRFQVTVFVFNPVHVSSRDLVLAEARAAEIFENVDIRVIWIAGLTAQDAVGHPLGEAWNPADLDLRLWTRQQARGAAIHSNALGYCLSIERGQAIILSDEIQNFATIWGIDLADILGVAMAHEIGHLLLRTSSHSPLGVMKAPYLQKDLTSAGRKSLIFTREEGNSMRSEVRRRMSIGIKTSSNPGCER
jgi:hypothetical protein